MSILILYYLWIFSSWCDNFFLAKYWVGFRQFQDNLHLHNRHHPPQNLCQLPNLHGPLEDLRRTYDQPLQHLNPAAQRKQTIILEYLRDEDAKQYEESNPFLFEQDRLRQIVIGNCRLLDPKLEKNGAYEFV